MGGQISNNFDLVKRAVSSDFRSAAEGVQVEPRVNANDFVLFAFINIGVLFCSMQLHKNKFMLKWWLKTQQAHGLGCMRADHPMLGNGWCRVLGLDARTILLHFHEIQKISHSTSKKDHLLLESYMVAGAIFAK
jgi:hypothetical protein